MNMNTMEHGCQSGHLGAYKPSKRPSPTIGHWHPICITHSDARLPLNSKYASARTRACPRRWTRVRADLGSF
jgi:hypothetical protein